VIVILAAAAIALWALRGGVKPSGKPIASDDRTNHTLLFVYSPDGVSAPADTIVLFGLVGEDKGSALLIPAGTTTDVPVHGPLSLGDSSTYGDPASIELATENLLGVRIDATVILDRHAFVAAISRLEPFDILVEERLGARQGNSIVTKFQPGRYKMDALTVNAYLELRAEGETEVARLARKQKVFEAILQKARSMPDGEFGFSGEDPTHLVSNVPISSANEIARALALREVSFSLLPVDPKQTLEGVESFEPREGEIRRVVTQRFPGAAVAPDVESRIRIGILNGNGGVAVTEDVAKRLIPRGYRVVYTENADRFDYEETQIVFYRTPDERIARDIRARLGTGRLVFNHQMQDVVDVLIVVGRDYPVGQGSQTHAGGQQQ